MPVYACIGSRETPEEIITEMTKLGVFFRENNIFIRSGHADGADWGFELGGQEKCIVYMPWAGFNDHLKSKAIKIPVDTSRPDLNALVDRYHPAPEKLSKGARALMARDGCQILGKDLNQPCTAVICWTKDGKDSGGTGQGIRVAKAACIPIINMYWPMYSTAEKVIKALKERNLL